MQRASAVQGTEAGRGCGSRGRGPAGGYRRGGVRRGEALAEERGVCCLLPTTFILLSPLFTGVVRTVVVLGSPLLPSAQKLAFSPARQYYDL